MASDSRRHNRPHRQNYRQKKTSTSSSKDDKSDKNYDENDPIIQAFIGFQVELDERNDRYERIVKLSRDITIESKRIIFLLHRAFLSASRDSILEESVQRFDALKQGPFKNIAREICSSPEGGEAYIRAYSPGLQEFIEAFCFFDVIKKEELSTWQNVKDYLQYPAGDDNPIMYVMIPLGEYLLGMLDVTGELMRACVASIGGGAGLDDSDQTPFKLCAMTQSIHHQCRALSPTGLRGIGGKLRALSDSVAKMERVCYVVLVRGEELPKGLLADIVKAPESAPPSGTLDDFPDMHDY